MHLNVFTNNIPDKEIFLSELSTFLHRISHRKFYFKPYWSENLTRLHNLMWYQCDVYIQLL